MSGDISLRRDTIEEVPGFRSVRLNLNQRFRPARFRRGLLFETERAIEINVGKASTVDWKRVALERPVLVDAADGESIFMFDEEGTFEQDFAAVSAPVAFTRKQRCLPGNIGLSEVNQEEAANFSRGLSGPEPQIRVRSVIHLFQRRNQGTSGLSPDDSRASEPGCFGTRKSCRISCHSPDSRKFQPHRING